MNGPGSNGIREEKYNSNEPLPDRRTGRGGEGARGAAAPPPKKKLGQREKIWAKSVFKDVSPCLFNLIILKT